MANKRIKDLTQTATTLASDDYVAIDGSSNGTRKIVKSDLVNDISSQVAGTYLDEANNLSDVASKDTSKLNLEVPDVGTAPNEVPLNGMLGSMAYQSSESVSIVSAEVETLEVTDKVTGPLTVSNTSAATSFILANSGGGTTLNFAVTENTGGIIDASEGASARNIIFKTGGTERVRIDSSGNTGFGQPNPSSRVDVNGVLTVDSDYPPTSAVGGLNLGDYQSGGYKWIQSLNSQPLVLNPTGNNVGIGTASPIGPLTVRVAADKNLVTSTQYSGASLEAVNDAYSANIPLAIYGSPIRLLSGNVEVNSGNIVMGSSYGIDFGSGDILDDYETGTATVAFSSGGGSVTINPSNSTIRYIKVGKLVHIHGEIAVSSVSSPSGNLHITGLPFPSASVGGYNRSTVALHPSTLTAATELAGFVENNSSYIVVRVSGGTTSGDTAASVIRASTAFVIGGTYIAST